LRRSPKYPSNYEGGDDFEVQMALQLVEMRPERFLYRCDSCAFVSPKSPVSKDELGAPPEHNCPNENQIDIDDIMDR